MGPDHEEFELFSKCQHLYCKVIVAYSHSDKLTFLPWQVIWMGTRNVPSSAERREEGSTRTPVSQDTDSSPLYCCWVLFFS